MKKLLLSPATGKTTATQAETARRLRAAEQNPGTPPKKTSITGLRELKPRIFAMTITPTRSQAPVLIPTQTAPQTIFRKRKKRVAETNIFITPTNILLKKTKVYRSNIKRLRL